MLTHGWAYGSKSNYKLAGKKIALAVTAGIDEAEYRTKAQYKYTLKELTAPLKLTFDYVRANYRPLLLSTGLSGTRLRIG